MEPAACLHVTICVLISTLHLKMFIGLSDFLQKTVYCSFSLFGVCSRKHDVYYRCCVEDRERIELAINFDLLVNEQAGKITVGDPPARATADRREE